MDDNKVIIKLSGIIPADDYRKVVEHFVGLINALTETVADQEIIDWQLSDLGFDNAIIGLAGYSKNQNAVLSVVAAYGVATRAAACQEPIPYPLHVRAQLEAITSLINGHITAIEFRTNKVESVIKAPLPPTDELPSQSAALGSVRGRVQTISEHTSLYFFLCDTVFDQAVRCSMKPEQQEMMRNIWGEEVIVTGTVIRDPSTGQPLSVHDIIDIEEIRPAPLSNHRRFRGILEFNPNEGPSEERVRPHNF